MIKVQSFFILRNTSLVCIRTQVLTLHRTGLALASYPFLSRHIKLGVYPSLVVLYTFIAHVLIPKHCLSIYLAICLAYITVLCNLKFYVNVHYCMYFSAFFDLHCLCDSSCSSSSFIFTCL